MIKFLPEFSIQKWTDVVWVVQPGADHVRGVHAWNSVRRHIFAEMSSKVIWQSGYEAGMDKLKRGYSHAREGGTNESRTIRRPSLEQENKRESSELAQIVHSSIDRSVKVVSNSSLSDREEPGIENASTHLIRSVLNSWPADDSIFDVVESALKTFDRARAIQNSYFIPIAQQRYAKSLQTYRTMFG